MGQDLRDIVMLFNNTAVSRGMNNRMMVAAATSGGGGGGGGVGGGGVGGVGGGGVGGGSYIRTKGPAMRRKGPKKRLRKRV